MALVGNVSEYEFGLANFLGANFEDEDSLELRTTPKPSRINIVENQPIDVAAKKYLIDAGAHQVKSETIEIGNDVHILIVSWIEPDGYLGLFHEFCHDY